MTHPNHQPHLHPAPAEIQTLQDTDPLPRANMPLTAEAHAGHMVQLDGLIEGLRQHYLKRNLFDESRGTTDNDPEATATAEERLDKELEGLQRGIDDLARIGDTAAIVTRLKFHGKAAQLEQRLRTGGDGGGGTVGKFSGQADDARNVANRTVFRTRTTGVSLFEAAAGIATPGKPTQDERDRYDQIAADQSLGQYASARDAVAATKATQARDLHTRNTNLRDGYDEQLLAIANRLSARHEDNRRHLRDMVDLTTRRLGTWNFQNRESYPGQADDLRDSLQFIAQELDDTVNRLSISDSARAELLGDYTRLRYRLEARGIYLRASSATSTTGLESAFMPDGGIRINPGDPDEEAIIYENGDSVRSNDLDENGSPIRRNAGGHPVPPERIVPLDLSQPHTEQQTEPTNILVNRWEQSREPQHAREAHAALVGDIAGMQSMDDRLTAHSRTLREELIRNKHSQDEIGTPDSPEKQAALKELKAEETQLTMEALKVRDQRRRGRVRLNRAQFVRSLIECGAKPPEQKQQSRLRALGRRMVGREIKSENEGAPILDTTGSIERNLLLNGIRDNWAIRADGTSARVVERVDDKGAPLMNPRTQSSYWAEVRNPDGSRHQTHPYW